MSGDFELLVCIPFLFLPFLSPFVRPQITILYLKVFSYYCMVGGAVSAQNIVHIEPCLPPCFSAVSKNPSQNIYGEFGNKFLYCIEVVFQKWIKLRSSTRDRNETRVQYSSLLFSPIFQYYLSNYDLWGFQKMQLYTSHSRCSASVYS